MRVKTWLAAMALGLVGWTAQAAPFFASKDGSMVWDKATGLVWMRCSLGQRWDGKSCIGAAKEYKFSEAQMAASAVNESGGQNGFRDWQVPSARQMSTLLMCSAGQLTQRKNIEDGGPDLLHTCPRGSVSPTTDPVSWVGTAAFYWTSSVNKAFAGSAWGMAFYDGSLESSSYGADGAVRLFRTPEPILNPESLFANELRTPKDEDWHEADRRYQAAAIAEKEVRNLAEKKAVADYQAAERKAEVERLAAKRKAEETERAAISAALRKGPQQLYLLAGQSQRGKSVEINGRSFGTTELYELIIDKFPSSEYAVKATDQLTAMDRTETQSRAVRNAAEAQRQADQNASNRAQCFSNVRSCEANCASAWSSDYRMAQSCVTKCQRSCN